MILPARIVRGDFGGDKVRYIALNQRNRERMGYFTLPIIGDVTTIATNAVNQAVTSAEGAASGAVVGNAGVQQAALANAKKAAASGLATWLLANTTYLYAGAAVIGLGVLALIFMPKRN